MCKERWWSRWVLCSSFRQELARAGDPFFGAGLSTQDSAARTARVAEKTGDMACSVARLWKGRLLAWRNAGRVAFSLQGACKLRLDKQQQQVVSSKAHTYAMRTFHTGFNYWNPTSYSAARYVLYGAKAEHGCCEHGVLGFTR